MAASAACWKWVPGSHPELTGRENIYMNGAILGMTKREITQNFDAIVDFSGTEKFLDTPVKRYSSGMYVRLAFAVAAHLSSEILIVDEVLAVGDAEFQKKCLSKMQDVAEQEGRTVLFVSHNIVAVKSLCNQCVLLRKGTVEMAGLPNQIVGAYLADGADSRSERRWSGPDTPGDDNKSSAVGPPVSACRGSVRHNRCQSAFRDRDRDRCTGPRPAHAPDSHGAVR